LLRILLVLVLACAVQPAAPMAWGAKAGAADWCRRLRENDKALASLLVMRTRAMATTDWVDFCVALGDNKELKELKASSHKLDALALAAFSDMLAKNTALECLALGDAELGDSGVTSLCAGLATNTALREIELDYKGLTSVGAAALAGALRSNRALRRLLVSRNPLGNTGVAALCEGLCESGVTDLQLEEVEMGDEGARSLAAALTNMKHIMSQVSVSGNEPLTGEGTRALVEAMSAGKGVESITFDHCPGSLSGDAASKLGDLLKSPTCPVQRLSFNAVVPPDHSKEALASGVGASSKLTHAKLVNMHLGDAAIASLASSLASNPSSGLKVLDLTGNQLTGDGLACLLLSDTRTLSKCNRLVMFDNRVGTGAHLPTLLQEAASSGREVCAGLEDLDIGGNKLEKDWILQLLSALRSTPSLFPSLRTIGLGGNEGMQDADAEVEAAVDALQERAIPLDVVYKAMGDDGKAGANARANQLAVDMASEAASGAAAVAGAPADPELGPD